MAIDELLEFELGVHHGQTPSGVFLTRPGRRCPGIGRVNRTGAALSVHQGRQALLVLGSVALLRRARRQDQL
jgi:hypothetical protein